MDAFKNNHLAESNGINSINKQHTCLRRVLCILFFTVNSLAAGLAGASSIITVLQPASVAANIVKQDITGQDTKPYISKKGIVFLDANTFLPRSKSSGKRMVSNDVFRGRALGISFFSEKKFNITVNSESRPRPDTLSLSGYSEGRSIATFSLTVTPESYLIRFQDLDEAIMYRVVGDTETGEGRVTEIDLRKMPPIRDMAPLIPPGK